MLQSAWRNAPEIKICHQPEAERETLIRRKLFVNLLIYPGVLVLDGPNVCSQMTEGDFWRTMVKEGAETLLRVSFDHTPKLPSDHYRLFLLKLEKLRIIKIPNFHCTNKQLESIAVRLPCLQ
jgi:hypothetical protein